MVLKVYYGNDKKVHKREFKNYTEAQYFIRYNEMQLKCLLGNTLTEVESKPKLDDELIRKVYLNQAGVRHYYILTVNDSH